MKYVLKLKKSTEFKNLKFKQYTNLYCKIHFSNETEIKFCYNIESKFFLIFSEAIRIFYFSTKIFEMKKKKNSLRKNKKKIEFNL